ncbi:MAG: hypothetical protein EA381_09755 [Planctomycetaceae bacterium]|nr:MAG: hypothetical protein EA381_09755 [Planctomycetaceae bacterium]
MKAIAGDDGSRVGEQRYATQQRTARSPNDATVRRQPLSEEPRLRKQTFPMHRVDREINRSAEPFVQSMFQISAPDRL